ncbi:MAG: sporulation protein YqfC [Bacillota bacterium]
MDKLKRQFIEVFDLSPEIAMDLPLIMMLGKEKIYLENHKGVSHFSDEELKIKIKSGFLVINGKKLIINEINSDYLSISGNIISVSYEMYSGGVING